MSCHDKLSAQRFSARWWLHNGKGGCQMIAEAQLLAGTSSELRFKKAGGCEVALMRVECTLRCIPGQAISQRFMLAVHQHMRHCVHACCPAMHACTRVCLGWMYPATPRNHCTLGRPLAAVPWDQVAACGALLRGCESLRQPGCQTAGSRSRSSTHTLGTLAQHQACQLRAACHCRMCNYDAPS